ncbi:MAG: nucleotidyltransferase [Phycisphaeraceae bacterium]
MPERTGNGSDDSFDWEAFIPDREWQIYQQVITEAQCRGLRFAVGGGLAFSLYSHHLRNTKDIDLYIMPGDRDAFVELLDAAGFQDLYPRQEYRRSWIYRSIREDVIVDVIWAMANSYADVDESWFEHAAEHEIRGVTLPLVPLEELIWFKLYVLHRDRCDWPDIFNILRLRSEAVDWNHLLARAAENQALLAGLLCVFHWLCPCEARQIPGFVWEKLGLSQLPPEPFEVSSLERAYLIDSYHDWFGATHADWTGQPVIRKRSEEGPC